LDGCGLLLVDLMGVTGCPKHNIREEKSLQEGGEDILIKDYDGT